MGGRGGASRGGRPAKGITRCLTWTCRWDMQWDRYPRDMPVRRSSPGNRQHVALSGQEGRWGWGSTEVSGALSSQIQGFTAHPH